MKITVWPHTHTYTTGSYSSLQAGHRWDMGSFKHYPIIGRDRPPWLAWKGLIGELVESCIGGILARESTTVLDSQAVWSLCANAVSCQSGTGWTGSTGKEQGEGLWGEAQQVLCHLWLFIGCTGQQEKAGKTQRKDISCCVFLQVWSHLYVATEKFRERKSTQIICDTAKIFIINIHYLCLLPIGGANDAYV